MRRAWLLALLVAACGPGAAATGPSPSPAGASPAPAASPSPEVSPSPAGLLFAVLEKAGGAQAGTVAIVGLDGYARAKVHFTPRTLPVLCDAALIAQPEARVAGGAVYYADGAGQVRRLTPDGRVTAVTQFALTSQQVLSLAVDPSGTQLLGSVLTVPKFSGGLPCQQQGSYVVDLEQATAGGHPQNVYHQAYAQADSSANFVTAVGWDPAGAQVTVHTSLGIQNGTYRKWWGELAHWTPQGIGSVVGGSGCHPQDEQGNSIACSDGSVRGPDGTVQWSLPPQAYSEVLLAPDATQAAFCIYGGGCGVGGRDGSPVKFTSFAPTGWLDGSTLIGTKGITAMGYGELETISLGNLGQVDDLGFNGFFAGVVQTG